MPPEILDYNQIGRDYSHYRQPDPRLALMITHALGNAQRIINVGAGTGSYEPIDRTVVAVEPSSHMIQQRRHQTAAVICAHAEDLPFTDGAFDTALAILSMHHWSDWQAGLREMRRVARDRVVLLTWDPDHPGFWLVNDYFPDLVERNRQLFPSIAEIQTVLEGCCEIDVECPLRGRSTSISQQVLGTSQVQTVPIPADCTDGFLGAYWRRPLAYLDAGARSAISTFSRMTNVDSRLDRLRADIESGYWATQYVELLALDQLDVGYRLVIHQCD